MEPKKPSPVDGVIMTSLDVLRKAGPGSPGRVCPSMFAAAIRQELQRSRDKGRGGWIDCDENVLLDGFAEHALKGSENSLWTWRRSSCSCGCAASTMRRFPRRSKRRGSRRSWKPGVEFIKMA